MGPADEKPLPNQTPSRRPAPGQAAPTSRHRPVKIDDQTEALLLALWRTPDAKGERRGYREVKQDLAAMGRRVSVDVIQRVCSHAHRDTIEQANARVREDLTGALDANVQRITDLADILATVARTGSWPSGEPVKGGVRVMAARDAIEASSRLLAYCGVQDSRAMLSPEEVVARARSVYGIDLDEEDHAEQQEETPAATHGGNGTCSAH